MIMMRLLMTDEVYTLHCFSTLEFHTLLKSRFADTMTWANGQPRKPHLVLRIARQKQRLSLGKRPTRLLPGPETIERRL